MIVLFVFLALILSLILWIMFVPVHLRINTDMDQYEVSQAGTLKICYHPWQRPAITMRILGFRIDMTRKERAKLDAETKKKETRRIKRSPSAWRYLIKGVFKSLRVNRFVCTVDLDDVVRSAQLVPLIMLINRGPVSVSTNFTNRYFLFLEMEGRINKVLWTILRFFTKK